VESSTGSQLRCALESSPDTLARFPHAFRAVLGFTLRGSVLRLDWSILNTGSRPMPFQLGYHPYFHVPEALKAKALLDTQEEGDFQGFDFTASELDLHLLDPRPGGVTLRRGGGLRDIALRYSPEFGVLVIWTLRGKEFICVEPWTAPGGSLAREGVLPTLLPGEERTLFFEIDGSQA
jgi:galactose mutarotase-like enzyme